MSAVLTAVGDSHTDLNAGYGVRPTQTWPLQLARLLSKQATPVTVTPRVFGISGETSTGLVARSDIMQMRETPDLAMIYTGANDSGASIATATTQANLQAVIKSLKHGAVGPGLAGGYTVAGQANLPATGRPGQRYVVLADTSTTGGVAAYSPEHTATITGSSAGQTVWEFRYALAGEYGWGRVATAATAPTACKRIVVLSLGYWNYTTGGDTLVTPVGSTSAVRVVQAAAVTAENVTVGGVATVVYADLYNFLRSRIVAGTDPDFSSVAYDQTRSWHYTLNNQHKNAYGHMLDAQAVLAALPAAWLTALAAL